MPVDSLKPPARCDGCGTTARGAIQHVDDDGVVVATYCQGCDALRELRGIEPGDHQQHRLLEDEA